MEIPIPSRLVRAWDAFCDWANVPIWRRGRLELRRLDIILVAFFFLCVGYYYWKGGPMGAIQGGLVYGIVAMLSLWMF